MIKCGNCGSILNLFGDVINDDEIIGCKVDDTFLACDECTFEYNSNKCKGTQGEKITIKDFKEANNG